MFTAAALVTSLLAVLLAFAAVRKLSHRPAVVATYARVGVAEGKLNYLALILLAGAAGLLVGLVWAPLGIAATVGVICYFLLAITAHLRHRDIGNVLTPITIELIAVAAIILRLSSL
jgi:hypothetical protein